MTFRKSLTKEQALQKLKHYCAYQERCHKEVRDKLYELGIWKKDHDEILATLIEEKYLDEERFAVAYAGGKFRIKKWGRVRIRYSLQQKQVSTYSVTRALKSINNEDYLETLRELATNKYKELKHEQYLIRKKKTIDHLMQKGYEPDLINQILTEIASNGEGS